MAAGRPNTVSRATARAECSAPLRTGFPDAGDNPKGQTERSAYDLLSDGFGPGVNAPLLVVADLRGSRVDAEDIPELAERIAAVPGIAVVGAPRVSVNGDTAVLPTLPTTEPADPDTVRTLERVRAVTPDGVYVTGPTALTLDLAALGVDPQQRFAVHDLLTDRRYQWDGLHNFVQLDPTGIPAHVFTIKGGTRTEEGFDYFA